MSFSFALGLAIIIVCWMVAFKIHARNFKLPEDSWSKIVTTAALPIIGWALWRVL